MNTEYSDALRARKGSFRIYMVAVAQLVEALVCGTSCWEFKSPPSPSKTPYNKGFFVGAYPMIIYIIMYNYKQIT